MNPLEALKEKLMLKPTLEERKQVAVVIKPNVGEPDIIVDETQNYYPREELLDKLAKTKLNKVTIKPVFKASVNKEPEPENNDEEPKIKKAIKIGKKKYFHFPLKYFLNTALFTSFPSLIASSSVISLLANNFFIS